MATMLDYPTHERAIEEGGVVSRPPILVTGMPRSGTSWVGKMLDASGEVVYIDEPLNVSHRPGQSPGVLRAPVDSRFRYISEANEHIYLEALRETLRFKYHFRNGLRRNRSLADLLRMLRHSSSFTRGRIRGRRPLLDDPFAVFSADWFARRLRCQVLVVVRHPAAIISSWKRLGWRADFAPLLRQPAMLADWLEPFRDEMEALRRADDEVAGGALLWRMVYSVIGEQKKRHPELHVVRHEDLSVDPVGGFAGLFAAFGLPLSGKTIMSIERATSGRGRERRVAWSLSKSGPSRAAFRRLDSRANASRWKSSLSPPEISRIRSLTSDVASLYYPGDEWE
jgi:hypothetical protein